MAHVTTKTPQDFVIATGQQYKVKDFINLSAKIENAFNLEGKILKKAYYNSQVIIEIDAKYLRPSEVDSLKGNL